MGVPAGRLSYTPPFRALVSVSLDAQDAASPLPDRPPRHRPIDRMSRMVSGLNVGAASLR